MKKAISCLLCLFLLLNTSLNCAHAAYNSQRAAILKEAGLMIGTENGISESRTATRAEIAAVTVRLLGGEQEAFRQRYSHPFTDVANWADAYIGYLYQYRIAFGTSPTQFSPNVPADENQFASLVLRALGYQDYTDGFTASNSADKSVEVGLLSQQEAAELAGRSTFTRADMMNIMYNSLFCKIKDSDLSLLEKLYRQGAVSYYSLLSMAEKDSKVKELFDSFSQNENEIKTPEELRNIAKNAAVTVEMGKNSNSFSHSGSGILIDSSGLVLTTYQNLVEGCLYGRVTFNGTIYYTVEKIVSYDSDANLALLKILMPSSRTAFAIGNTSKLKEQETVYLATKSSTGTLSFRSGKVTRTSYSGEFGICIDTDFTSQALGGVLLNSRGEAVAMDVFSEGSSMLAVSEYKTILK